MGDPTSNPLYSHAQCPRNKRYVGDFTSSRNIVISWSWFYEIELGLKSIFKESWLVCIRFSKYFGQTQSIQYKKYNYIFPHFYLHLYVVF